MGAPLHRGAPSIAVGKGLPVAEISPGGPQEEPEHWEENPDSEDLRLWLQVVIIPCPNRRISLIGDYSLSDAEASFTGVDHVGECPASAVCHVIDAAAWRGDFDTAVNVVQSVMADG